MNLDFLTKLDFLKKAKKSEIRMLAILACGIIIVGYYFLFLSPIASKLPSLFRETSRIQNMLSKAELAINNMPKIKKEIELLKSKENLYGGKLPKEEEFPAVLENLSNMAQNSGVKITKIMPKKESLASSKEKAESQIYRQQSILIDALCGYHQLGPFIAELEKAERFMEVSDIRIEAGKANLKRHNIQLVVTTFILKGEEEGK